MKIKNVTFQHGRDFYADYICEHCGNIENKSGYNDHFFRDQVIPKMKCSKCLKDSKGKIETKGDVIE